MIHVSFHGDTEDIPFSNGFVKDSFAKSCQPIQGRDFLYTGKPAAVGQRLEIQASPVGLLNFCRLSGILTELGPLPSYEQWLTTTSIVNGEYWKRHLEEGAPLPCRGANAISRKNTGRPACPNPDCLMCQLCQGQDQVSYGELYERSLKVLGTKHGQTATGLCYLNAYFWENQNALQFKAGRLYQVKLKVDDRLEFVWTLESVRDVTAEHTVFEELPEVFRKWAEGHRESGFPPEWYGGEEYVRKVLAEEFGKKH